MQRTATHVLHGVCHQHRVFALRIVTFTSLLIGSAAQLTRSESNAAYKLRVHEIMGIVNRFVTSAAQLPENGKNSKACFFDVGANNGDFSRRVQQQLHRKAPSVATRFVLFEPQPHFQKTLSSMAEAWGGELVAAAAWTHDTNLTFHLSKNSETASLSNNSAESTLASINVRAVDLAEYLERELPMPALASGPRCTVSFLKLDIEGAEYEVLPRLLGKGSLCRLQYVLIEWHLNKTPLKRRGHALATMGALRSILESSCAGAPPIVIYDEIDMNNADVPLANASVGLYHEFVQRRPQSAELLGLAGRRLLVESPEHLDHARDTRRLAERSGLVVYTCVTGGFEKTFKEPADCKGADFIAFTDSKEQLAKPQGKSCWKVRPVGQHMEAIHDPRYRGMRNSLENNQAGSNVAKWYKVHAHLIRDLMPYKYALYMDGTVRLRLSASSLVMQAVLDNLSMITAFQHCTPRPPSLYERCRHGNLDAEVFMTRRVANEWRKFVGGLVESANKTLFDANVAGLEPMRQWYYNHSGWTRRWFDNHPDFSQHAPTPLHRKEYGLWWCGMLFYNLANPDTGRYLETWWEENANQTMTDQVTFAFAGWRTGLLVHSLPQHGVNGSWFRSSIHIKGPHGK